MRRAANLELGMEQLDVLAAYDFKVQEFSDYHWRINGRLDVWPSSRKWHDIISKRGGTYVDLLEMVKRELL